MASNVVDNDGNNPTNTTAPFNATTVKTVSKIPLMTINAGPRDGDLWNKRLKEEFTALILYIKNNKAEDNDWFNIKPKDKTGTFCVECSYSHTPLCTLYHISFFEGIPLLCNRCRMCI